MKKYISYLLALFFALAAYVFKYTLAGYAFTAGFFSVLAGLCVLYGMLHSTWANRKQPRLMKGLRTTFIACLLAGIAVIGAVELPIIANAKTDAPPDAPYVIVLGAALYGELPSIAVVERLTAAKEYLEQNPGAKAVLTGGMGPGETISEAEGMSRWLKRQGISPDRLILEDRATNTRQNIEYSLKLIKEQTGSRLPDPVVVVSNEYHLYRAKYLTEQAEAQAAGVAARTTQFPLMLNYFLREAFGMMHTWVMGLFQ